MACHMVIAADREPIKKIAAAYDKKQPIEWVKVHDLPDYAYFNHSAHVTRGVGCVSCHPPGGNSRNRKRLWRLSRAKYRRLTSSAT